MRVLVAGSQDWPDPYAIFDELDEVFSKSGGDLFVLVHGHCPNGADAYAEMWAVWMRSQGYSVVSERHPANWKKFGRPAGYRRNAEMVALGADLCLVFINNESNGSTHTRKLAIKAGIETKTFRRTTVKDLANRKKVYDEVTFLGARIMWRNFAGAAKLYNEEGQRNFSIKLEEDLYNELLEKGWEPKRKEPRNSDEEPMFHLPVKVLFREDEKFAHLNPRIFLITESTRSRSQLSADLAVLADTMVFDNVDVTVRPYNWGPYRDGGDWGVKAYLRTFFGTLREDPLEQKYADYVDLGDVLPPEIENLIDAEAAYDTGWMQDGQLKEIER